MKERPILFSGDMVKAILDGRKTMTRRVIKPQPPDDCAVWAGWVLDSTADKEIGSATWADTAGVLTTKTHHVKCPYGHPGDRLWVREAMCIDAHECDWHYKADFAQVMVDKVFESGMRIWAHHQERSGVPSIHMPRWASRITLEITGVRAERLQEIKHNPTDFILEGIPRELGGWGDQYGYYSTGFINLWNSLNAKCGYSWDGNWWVWVVEFKRINP